MRPTPSKFTNPTGLVDKRVGEHYTAIENVNLNLDKVAHLSYYMESLFNLDRNLTLLSDENVDHHILKDITIFQGPSAYELALKYGYVGNESQWVASLKGEDGEDGEDGSPGVIDLATLTTIQDGIAANTLSITNLAATVEGLTSNNPGYVTVSEIESLETSILAQVNTSIEQSAASVISQIPTTTSIHGQVNSIVDGVLAASNAALDGALGRIDAADALIQSLRGDLDDNTTDLSSYIIQNDQMLIRLDVAEALAGENNAKIINLDTVTAELVTSQTILSASSGQNESNITNLQSASAAQALTIETLNTVSGANQSSIINIQQTTAESATQITTLQASSATAFSNIATLSSVQSDHAIVLNNISTNVGSNSSSILTLQETTATHALDLTQLNTRTEGTESSITNLQLTKADASALETAALRITDIESRIQLSLPPGIEATVQGDLTFTKNYLTSGPNAGEILVNAGTLEHPDLGVVTFSNQNLTTLFEGSNEPSEGEPFYIVWSPTDASARFVGVNTEHFFLAYYKPDNDEWRYIKTNSSASEPFVPVNGDRLVAVGRKDESDTEISSLISLINYTAVQASITSIQSTYATKTELFDEAAAIQIDRVAAETAAANAYASEENAAQSYTDAEGAAASALASQTVSANTKDAIIDIASFLENDFPTKELWSHSHSGSPDEKADLPNELEIDGSYRVFGNNAAIGPKRVYAANRVYEATVDIDLIAHDGTCNIQVQAYALDDSYQPVDESAWSVMNSVAQTDYGRKTHTVRFTAMDPNPDPGTVNRHSDYALAKKFSVRAGIRYGGTGAEAKVYSLIVRDITSEVLGEIHAGASASSAQTAEASENAAGQHAIAAQSAQTGAETAEANAYTSEQNSSQSETNSAGSAAAALDSQQGAAQSATDAGNDALAAFNSEQAASTSATAAGDSAAEAGQSAGLTVSVTRANIVPGNFLDAEHLDNFYSHGLSGHPDTAAGASLSAIHSAHSDGDGDCAKTAGNDWLVNRGVLPLIVGDTYRLRIIAKEVVVGNGLYTISPRVVDGNYNHINMPVEAYNRTLTFPALGVMYEDEVVFTITQADWDNGARYVRGGVLINNGATTLGTYHTYLFELKNITAETRADEAASAAFTSEQNASASQDAAGASAIAADQARIAAETAESNALISEGNSATSETNAAGSASDASTFRDIAVAAGGSAELAAMRQLPGTFEDEGSYFTNQRSSSPEVAQDATNNVNIAAITDAVEGAGLNLFGTGSYLYPKGALPYIVGNTYRLTTRIRENITPTNDNIRISMSRGSGDHTFLNQTLTGGLSTINGSVVEFVEEYTATQDRYDAGARWIRGGTAHNLIGSGSNDGDWDIFLLKFENITESFNAGTSAVASASSAAQASASETEAGSSAEASEASRLAAETAEGNAEIHKNSAASSANDAEGSASNAYTSEQLAATAKQAAEDAQAASSISEGNAVSAEINANNAATQAESYKNLASRIVNGSVSDNSSFADYSSAGGVPPEWGSWNSSSATYAPGLVSENAVRLVGPIGAAAGLRQIKNNCIKPNAWMVIEAECVLNAGTFNGAGVLVSWRKTVSGANGSATLPFKTSKDETGEVAGDGVVGQRYRFTKLVRAGTLTYGFYLYLMNHWVYHSGGQNVDENDITWHKVSLRNATQTEIDAGRVIDIEADIAINATTLASLEGYSAASYGIQLGANGAMANFSLRAESTGIVTYTEAKFDVDKLIHSVDGETIWESDTVGITLNKVIRTVANLGTDDATMYVIGNAFGANSDLLHWYGPYSAGVSGCTPQNAIRALTIDGKSYLNGIQEGVSPITASDSTTTSTVAEVTSIGANGNDTQATMSYGRGGNNTYYTSTNVANNTYTVGSATVELWRREGTGAYVKVETFTVSGTKTVTNNGWDHEFSAYLISENFSMSKSHTRSQTSNAAYTYDWKTVLSAESGVPSGSGWSTSKNVSVSIFEAAN